jgi:hypothetical protein
MFVALAVVLAACVQGGGPNPNPTPTADLSIGAPFDGQSLAGTIIVMAGGIGGVADDLTFTLGDLDVEAEDDGTAVFDTRALDDGDHTLTATATIDGETVSDSLNLTFTNDLPDSGQVGPDGGTLKSGEGSYATLPPGALIDNANLTLTDTSQQQILTDFGVNYTDLGVTFLGALTIDATGTSSERTNTPVQVDLAGWAQAVQPRQDVVMFNVLPDANGDGIGELTFAANARATPDGSVVTVPTARTEVYGLAASDGSLRLQQASSVRPGQIVTLQGRGLTPFSVLGNTARFGNGVELLAVAADLESASANPLQSVLIAVPALPGKHDVTLRNIQSGFKSEPLTLDVGAAGSGSQATWDAFVEQLATALSGTTEGRPGLFDLGDGYLQGIASDATLRAMVANSGLVTAANLVLLDGIGAGSYDAVQRDLVQRHALLLDALAGSAPSVATSAADLASLLMVATPTGSAVSEVSLRRQQATGGPCAAPTAPVFWGAPTGMGSAPPGSCGGGSAGGGSGGSSPLRQQRLGDFGPVSGAIVRVLTADGSAPLSPFTSVTLDAGSFYIPFIPPGEPFLVRAFDLASGDSAEAIGVAGAINERVDVSLAFAPDSTNDGPIADFVVTEVNDDFPGGGHYRFTQAVTLKDGAEIVDFRWLLDGVEFAQTFGGSEAPELSLLRNGSYTVSLSVVDELGLGDIVEKIVVVNDLPHAYAALPPVRVNTAADGSEAVGESEVSAYVSDDGRHVLFGSDATNLIADDGNGEIDIFLKDLDSGAIERVSQAIDGTETNGRSGQRGFHLVGSGQTVAFYSQADNLDAGCVSGGCSYVLDRDAGTLTAVQGASGGSALYEAPILSPNERYLAFRAGSIAACQSIPCNVFVEDLETGNEMLATAAADGTAGNAQSTPWGFTADGRKLLFSSRADNLVPNDTNGVHDISRISTPAPSNGSVSPSEVARPMASAAGAPSVPTGAMSPSPPRPTTSSPAEPAAKSRSSARISPPARSRWCRATPSGWPATSPPPPPRSAPTVDSSPSAATPPT